VSSRVLGFAPRGGKYSVAKKGTNARERAREDSCGQRARTSALVLEARQPLQSPAGESRASISPSSRCRAALAKLGDEEVPGHQLGHPRKLRVGVFSPRHWRHARHSVRGLLVAGRFAPGSRGRTIYGRARAAYPLRASELPAPRLMAHTARAMYRIARSIGVRSRSRDLIRKAVEQCL